MDAWWHSLGLDQQIFLVIAALGTLGLVVQIVMMVAGVSHGDLAIGDADPGSVGDHASGLSFLSVRSLVAFTAGLGWTGFALSHAGMSAAIATAGGVVVGGALMWSVVSLMRAMMRLSHNGALDYRNALGQAATVYISIPPALSAAGQVEVLVQGRLSTVLAMTRATHTLPPRSKVRVIELVDRTTVLVEPLT